MNATPLLLGYAAAVGFAAPGLLSRSRWPHRAPFLAVVVWHTLAASFALSIAMAAFHMVAPSAHLDAGLIGVLHSCGLPRGAGAPAPASAGGPALALPAGMALTLLGAFGYEVLRARRQRSRHLAVLDMVGRRSTRLHATVLDHPRPAAYCLPGRRPRVVVSEGALRLLSAEQLNAVLEHERAHIAGRHHLAMAAAEAFARVFRWIPLARSTREQTSLLLEMVADDRALRRHQGEVLASAMYEMAAATAPRGAFAAGGPGTLLRMQRVLTPRRGPHFALRGALVTAAAAVLLLPLMVACTPGA